MNFYLIISAQSIVARTPSVSLCSTRVRVAPSVCFADVSPHVWGATLAEGAFHTTHSALFFYRNFIHRQNLHRTPPLWRGFHDTSKGEPPTRVLPLSLQSKEIHPLLRFTNDREISLSAESDLGRRPKYPQAFEKSLTKTFIRGFVRT